MFLAASGLGGLAVLQWSHRRGTLLRLRALMGESNAAGGGFVSLLEQLGTHLPGASDDSLRTVLTNAGFFRPAALPLFVASRLIATCAVFFIVLMEKAPIRADTLMLAVFLAFFTSRLFVIMV
jgi:hypothetical protein